MLTNFVTDVPGCVLVIIFVARISVLIFALFERVCHFSEFMIVRSFVDFLWLYCLLCGRVVSNRMLFLSSVLNPVYDSDNFFCT